MHLQPHQLYHVYNRGNNRNRLFYDPANYELFMFKMRKYLIPHCHLLAYSLLPNHFHFLVTPNELTNVPYTRLGVDGASASNSLVKMTQFSHGLQMLLSSYAKAINHKYKRRGSLFTQNTHCKLTSSEAYLEDYSLWCFSYIHYNPVAAGLVNSPEKWKYSSFNEYLGRIVEPLCDLDLGRAIFSLDINDLYRFTTEVPDDIYSRIF